MRFFANFTRRSWAIGAILFAAGLAVAASALSTRLQIGDIDPGAPELRPNSRYNRDTAYMASHYAASSDVFVVMVTTPYAQCGQYDTLSAVDQLEQRLRAACPAHATLELDPWPPATPAFVSPDDPVIVRGMDAIERATGVRPVTMRSGGTIPVMAALALQLCIGIFMVLRAFPLPLAAAHNAGAALLVAATVLLNRKLRPVADFQ